MTRSQRAPGAVDDVDGTGRSIAIVCARFNDLVVERLEAGARRSLVDHGVSEDDISTLWVPGALEIPQVAMAIARTGRVDAVVALGAVVRGDTYHFEVVAEASASGLMDVSLQTGVVVTNGILTVDNVRQAIVRTDESSPEGNKGAAAALAALETLAVLDALAAPPSQS